MLRLQQFNSAVYKIDSLLAEKKSLNNFEYLKQQVRKYRAVLEEERARKEAEAKAKAEEEAAKKSNSVWYVDLPPEV